MNHVGYWKSKPIKPIGICNFDDCSGLVVSGLTLRGSECLHFVPKSNRAEPLEPRYPPESRLRR